MSWGDSWGDTWSYSWGWSDVVKKGLQVLAKMPRKYLVFPRFRIGG
jgi:hypothetical protein